jgi:hypothetical protein
MNATAVVDQGSAAAQRAGWRSAHVCQNRDFGQEATCRSKPGGRDMVEVKSDIEKFETTLTLGKMGANFRKSSPNTKEPSAHSIQDCDWDPRVAAGPGCDVVPYQDTIISNRRGVKPLLAMVGQLVSGRDHCRHRGGNRRAFDLLGAFGQGRGDFAKRLARARLAGRRQSPRAGPLAQICSEDCQPLPLLPASYNANGSVAGEGRRRSLRGFRFNFQTAEGICVCVLAATNARALRHVLTLSPKRGRRESRVPIAPVGPVQQKARG